MATLYALKKYEEIEDFFFGEGNWSSEEKENVENIWVRILFGQWRRGSSEKKKYLEKENIWSAEVVEKEENI